MKDVSNISIRTVMKKRGTLDDVFVVDLIPIRLQREHVDEEAPYHRALSPEILQRCKKFSADMVSRSRAKVFLNFGHSVND